MYKEVPIHKVKDDILYDLLSKLDSLNKQIMNKINIKENYKKAKKLKKLIDYYLICQNY